MTIYCDKKGNAHIDITNPDVNGSLPLADLEKRLDEALVKETPEMLRKWLEEKRK